MVDKFYERLANLGHALTLDDAIALKNQILHASTGLCCILSKCEPSISREPMALRKQINKLDELEDIIVALIYALENQ